MSQITEHKTARDKWLIYRAQEYFLKQAEALGFENPEGFENPDEDDDEVWTFNLWCSSLLTLSLSFSNSTAMLFILPKTHRNINIPNDPKTVGM